MPKKEKVLVPGTFHNRDKLYRAQMAVVEKGGKSEDYVEVLREYLKLRGPYTDNPDSPLLPLLVGPNPLKGKPKKKLAGKSKPKKK